MYRAVVTCSMTLYTVHVHNICTKVRCMQTADPMAIILHVQGCMCDTDTRTCTSTHNVPANSGCKGSNMVYR